MTNNRFKSIMRQFNGAFAVTSTSQLNNLNTVNPASEGRIL